MFHILLNTSLRKQTSFLKKSLSWYPLLTFLLLTFFHVQLHVDLVPLYIVVFATYNTQNTFFFLGWWILYCMRPSIIMLCLHEKPRILPRPFCIIKYYRKNKVSLPVIWASSCSNSFSHGCTSPSPSPPHSTYNTTI